MVWIARFGHPRVDITTTVEFDAPSRRAAKSEAARLKAHFKISEKLSLLEIKQEPPS